MKTDNVSESIFSNSKGWFRYNYDQGRLEFLNHETKLVVQIWTIPADQWEALPSQRDYCENIVRQASQQAQNKRKGYNKYIFSEILGFIGALLFFISPKLGCILIIIGAIMAGIAYNKF